MGGGAQTPALTALLCLGLCRVPGDGAQAGTLPKPSIWADPGPLVAIGSPVTLWCQGSLQAEVYHMYTESGRHPWEARPQQDSRHKASFSVITSMSSHDTGQYCCVYWTLLGHSQPSDPLTLVVTGGPEPSSPSHPQPGSPTAPAPEDHSLENLIRIGVAGLVLLGIGLLLADAWYSHKRTRAAGQQ